jgi:hypothetical protein
MFLITEQELAANLNPKNVIDDFKILTERQILL